MILVVLLLNKFVIAIAVHAIDFHLDLFGAWQLHTERKFQAKR